MLDHSGHSSFLACSCMLNKHCGKDSYEIILFDKGHNKQETRKKERFQQYEFKHHYSMVLLSVQWSLNGYHHMKQPFWIKFG